MKTSTITSIIGYIDILKKVTESHGKNNRGLDFMYRGVSNDEYELIPCAFRRDKNNSLIYGDSENEILSHFIKESQPYLNNIDKSDILSYLITSQHYGVPTRLLDFTSNPLVAMYFACRNQNNDGQVFIFNETNYITYMAQRKGSSELTRNQLINQILDNITDNKECIKIPISYGPHIVADRMAAQSSRFLIWGSEKTSLESMLDNDAYIQIYDNGLQLYGPANMEEFLYKIEISKNYKDKILTQLSILGINEKSLFPGLDGLGAHFESFYRQRDNKASHTFGSDIW